MTANRSYSSRFMDRLKNLKLSVKFFLILLTSLTLLFCGFVLTSRMTDQEYNNALYKQSVQLLTLFAQNIQEELNKVADSSFEIIADNVIQDGLSRIKKNANGTPEWIEARKAVNDRLLNLSLLHSDVLSILIQAADKKTTEFWQTASSRISSRLPLELLQPMYENNGREIWVSHDSALFLARNIREVADLTMASIGSLVMQIDIERIVSRCSAPLSAMDMPLDCSIRLDDICVFSTRKELNEVLPDSSDYFLHQSSDGVLFCVQYTPSGSRWSYTAAVPYEGIVRSSRYASSVTIFLALAVLGVALGLGTLLNSSIIRDFRELLVKYDTYAKGELSLPQGNDPYQGRTDEIGELHEKFIQMAIERQHMVDEIYVKQQLLLEAQLDQLRGQVNPHFLYNTLESIYCLAEVEGNDRIAVMTSSLGKLLRTTLKEKRNVITIREDLEIAREYMRIQSIRFGEQLKMIIDVGEEYQEHMIPPMTIQPLVENAVLHGAEEMVERCEIIIECKTCGDHIELSVEDNGPGMDEDILEKLEQHVVEGSGLGIGLMNIHKRIQLAFRNTDCGLEIRRNDGKTAVIVKLPLEESIHD